MQIPCTTRSFQIGTVFASLVSLLKQRNKRSERVLYPKQPSCTWNLHPLALTFVKLLLGRARSERAFLVTSLHEQRSNPLAAGEWKLCSHASYPHRVAAWKRGSSGSESYPLAVGRVEASALKSSQKQRPALSRPSCHRFIALKNSSFDLVFFILSSMNSIAASSSIGCSSLRRIQIFCSMSGSISNSSRRVPERLMLIDG